CTRAMDVLGGEYFELW
nr:immunoglobulin heavy chain junction region [Macaca mulatta]MOV49053.1 immunoglobulin heavy chain junction region [Macaca mulatta]MOV49474.1 immunoglobulin heavy chain junction region [Macaca mulatta]MOV49581.1 immunoglobulin heavy chain junction region [Macaca mulatta]MOV51544.1 immunoglobulin heavy chain junction region [Macaca mulatta]